MTDLTPTDIDVQTSVQELMGDLPPAVRNFLKSPARDRVAFELSQKYNLHTDQAGEFQKSYLFMLLGIYSPEEFVASLSKIGLSKEVVAGLAADVNTQVFIPVRHAERRASEMPLVSKPATTPAAPPSLRTPAPAPTPVAPVAQNMSLPAEMMAAPLPSVPQHPTASISAPAAQNVHIYVGAQTQAPAPSPTHIFVPMQSVASQQVQAVPTYSEPVPQLHPAARTMASDMEMVKEMREGSHAQQTPVQAPAPTYTPQPQPIYAPVPPRPVYQQRPEVATPPPVAQGANSDPYREPV